MNERKRIQKKKGKINRKREKSNYKRKVWEEIKEIEERNGKKGKEKHGKNLNEQKRKRENM